MKRGGVRTSRKYTTDEDGKRLIKYEIQGRRRGVWIPVVETDQVTKKQIPMVYDTLKEAEKKVKKIARSIRGKK